MSYIVVVNNVKLIGRIGICKLLNIKHSAPGSIIIHLNVVCLIYFLPHLSSLVVAVNLYFLCCLILKIYIYFSNRSSHSGFPVTLFVCI